MTVEILQWGCGNWGANVLRDLNGLGANVTVLVRGEESVRRAAEGGAARVVRSVDEVESADGVVVVTPSWHHADAIRASARLGCPIFCEKALVTDPSVETELVALCGERLFVMHKWRWHPGIEALCELAREGVLGEVHAVRSSRLGWGPFHEGVDGIDTLAPHDLSIVLAVLGSLPPVTAARGTRSAEGWCEFSALLAGDGPHAALECSTVSATRLRRVEVTGTLGSAVLPDTEAPAVELLLYGGDLGAEPDRREIPLAREWPLLRELRDFVDHCVGGPPPRAPAAEGFEVVRRIADLRAALDRGQTRPS
jgi:predicted dehydrogenase